MIEATITACCRANSRGTNQQLLLVSQIDQIGVKHLDELEDIRYKLEAEDEVPNDEDQGLKDFVVLHMTEMASKLENDILDYSQEFENDNLKKLLSLLRVWKLNNKKMTSFNVEKFGEKKFKNFALTKIDQIIEILDDMVSYQQT